MNQTLKTLASSFVLLFLAALWWPAQDQHAIQPPQKDDKKTAAWMDPDKSEPGSMKYRTFQSEAINGQVSYLIYLPPGYDKDKDQRYPVVYWLHGRGGSQTGASQLASRLDKAIKAGKASPMIVVGVNGMRTSSYVDSADGKMPVQSVIVKELIPHIDATYRTLATREGRIIEGFSMGGAGAAKIGFKYPELFGAVSILAGALHDLDSTKTRGTTFRDIYGGREDYFQANSPWKLVEKNAEAIRGKTAIRIVVGDKDGLLGRNREYHELLEKLKISHEFRVIKDVGHAAGPLYDALGEKNWRFYTQALGGEVKPAASSSLKEPSSGKAPSQAENPEIKWQLLSVKTADGVITPALWTAPAGKGPFPVVVFFHGAPGGDVGLEHLLQCGRGLGTADSPSSQVVAGQGARRGIASGRLGTIVATDWEHGKASGSAGEERS